MLKFLSEQSQQTGKLASQDIFKRVSNIHSSTWQRWQMHLKNQLFSSFLWRSKVPFGKKWNIVRGQIRKVHISSELIEINISSHLNKGNIVDIDLLPLSYGSLGLYGNSPDKTQLKSNIGTHFKVHFRIHFMKGALHPSGEGFEVKYWDPFQGGVNPAIPARW